MVPPHGIEPRTDAYKATVMPFNYKGVNQQKNESRENLKRITIIRSVDFNKELSTKNEIRENHNQDNQISTVKRCLLVGVVGFAPTIPNGRQILSLECIPIPP